MNKVYKTIWNSVTRSWTAVSEWQLAHKKSVKSYTGVFLVTLLFSNSVLATGTFLGGEDLEVGLIALGSNDAPGHYSGITYVHGDGHSIVFSTRDTQINEIGGSIGLFNLSSNGFVQRLTDFDDLSNMSGAGSFDSWNTHISGAPVSDNGNVGQNLINESGDVIARLTFAIGDAAYQLINQNQANFGVTEGQNQNGESGIVIVGSDGVSRVFGETGISYEGRGNFLNDYDDGHWTLAVLKQVDIDSGKTLVLDGITEQGQTWSAKITGNGNITYSGTGSVEIKSTIVNGFDDKNIYTGSTTVDGVTLVLRKSQSLGYTSLLEILNDGRVYANTNTEKVNALQVTNGTLFIQNEKFEVRGKAVIGTEGEIQGQNVALNVTDGGELLVQNSNTNLVNSAVTANKITVTTADAFGSETKATATTDYIFEGVTDEITDTPIDATTVVLQANESGTASHITYDPSAKITTSSTTISDGSSLTITGKSQLGDSVAFNDGGEDVGAYNKLTINHTDDLNGADGTWTFGGVDFASGDNNAIVVANGNSNTDLRFTIPDSSKWTNYKGWLRISNTSFNLDTTLANSIFSRTMGESVGLSVGSNGHVNISDREVSIDRFGWSNDGGNNGILDISHISEPQGSSNPILTVTDLWLQGGGSVMMLDPKDYLQQGSAATNDSVLDYQTSDNRFYLIEVTGTISGEGAITLVDQSGTVITADKDVVEIYGTDKDKAAANGTWTYNAQLDKDKDGKRGVYLTYSLSALELLGTTNADQALLLNLQDAQHRDLYIPVSGSGILKINATGTDEKTITLSNANNTFSGLVDAGEGVQLTATAGALGTGGAALRLDDGASLTFGDSKSKVTQKLNGLALGTGSSINLGHNTTLELNLNSDYLNSVAPVTTAEIGTNQLLGSGGLTLTAGTLSFTDTSDLFAKDGYQGALTVTQGAMMAFSDSNGDSYTLKELHGNGTASLNGQVILGDLSDFSGDLKLVSGTQVEFDANTQLSDRDSVVLDVFSDANDTSVRFNAFTTDANQVIDQSVSFGSNIDKFSFNNTKGVFKTDRELSLTLDGNSTIIRNRDVLDSAKIGESSELLYNIKNASSSYDLTNTSGSGTLTLAFDNHNESLSISGTGSGFSGTFRFDNAVLEVGANHTGDANNTLATNNSLYVGDGSTLVLNGKQTLGKALTLGSGSSLDFTANSDSYVMEGTSVNALNMDGNTINLGVGENVQVSVEVDTSVAIKEADTSGTLMEAVRDQDRDGLSLVLIDNIGGDGVAKDLANHMQLVGTDSNQSATVTYQNADGEAIADITTGIGLAGVENQIGLTYDKVTNIAIYDGQTAVFEATGDGDVISAQITNKEGGTGSVHYTGEGAVTLTNSDNDYTGSTTIDGQVSVVADANNALGHSSKLTVGTDSRGSLQVNADQEHLGGLVVNTTGSLTIAEGKVMTLNDSADNVIEGNLDGKGTIRLVKSDLTYTTDVEKVLSVAFETDDDSTLTKDGIGKLDFEQTLSNLNLNLAQGGIVLDNGDSLGKFVVVEGTEVDVNGLVNITELTGTGATFNMAVAFGEGSQEELTDGRAGLHIGTGSGDHFLKVSSKDLNKGAEESIKIVQIDQGDATFALANGLEAVTSGAFDYTLVKQTQDDATSYFLDSTSGSGTDTDPDADAEKVRNTTVTAGSYIGIAYAAQLFDVSLHDRVGNRDWINPVTGEKHSTSLWMQHTMSHERFRDTTSQLRMRATSNTTILGGDFIQYTADDGALAYAGLMGGYGTMDTKSGSVVTGLHSKAETDAWGVGIYGGWKADENGQTGPYVDGWVMFTHAKSDVSGVDQYVEDVKGQGLSASVEVGWGVPAGTIANDDGSVTQVTFEPHASVTWFGMEFDDLHTDVQDVAFEGKNNVRTRLGARAVISEKGNDRFNAFVEANWVHNTQEYGATISGLTVDQAGARNQAETRLGVDWRISEDLFAWGRVGASFGSNNYSDREGSVGIRYQF